MNTTTTLPPALAALRDAAKAALDRADAEQARREAYLRDAVSKQARLEPDVPLEIWQFPHLVAVPDVGGPYVEWRIPGFATIRAEYYAVNPTWDRGPRVRREGWLVRNDDGWQKVQTLGEALALAERTTNNGEAS